MEAGPPAPGATMAMMEALALQDIGAKSKGDINEMLDKLNKMDSYQVQDMFPICKIEKAYKTGTANILFTCRDQEVRQHILSALHNAEKTACSGPAPAGYVEDELTLWMDAMIDEL